MAKQKTGVLLMNIGTPSSPTIKGVRDYLREFLSDPDVIDSNPILRWAIVNLIVVPFRPKRVLPQYKSIWMDDGSPLLVNSLNFKDALNESLDSMIVEVGMRYGSPSIESAINKLEESGVNQIILCPMFPQYAQATTGSCITFASKILDSRNIKYKTITGFFREEFFIESVVNKIKSSKEYHDSEMILFSFHGLPERQVKKLDRSSSYRLMKDDCCSASSEFNQICYIFHATESVKLIMDRLGDSKPYKMCFQSRFGLDKWLQPDILDVLQETVDEGITKISVACPSFVADCLETLEEISIRDFEIFESIGGDKLDLIPSLNDSEDWVKGFASLLESKL